MLRQAAGNLDSKDFCQLSIRSSKVIAGIMLLLKVFSIPLKQNGQMEIYIVPEMKQGQMWLIISRCFITVAGFTHLSDIKVPMILRKKLFYHWPLNKVSTFT